MADLGRIRAAHRFSENGWSLASCSLREFNYDRRRTAAVGNEDAQQTEQSLNGRQFRETSLRKKIMAFQGVEVVGACDLTEAASIWHRDRDDAVLIDTRRDHHGCIAWRNEIKGKATASGIVCRRRAGCAIGRFLAQAIRESCASLRLCGYWRLRKSKSFPMCRSPIVRRTTDRYRSTRVSRPDAILDNGRSGDATTRFPTLL